MVYHKQQRQKNDYFPSYRTDFTTMRYYLLLHHNAIHTLRMAIIKKKKERKRTLATAGRDIERLEPSYIAFGNGKWCSCVENSLAAPQMVKHRVMSPAILPLGT